MRILLDGRNRSVRYHLAGALALSANLHSPIVEVKLKEQVLWIERFETLGELRAAVREFARAYNREWLIERHGYAHRSRRASACWPPRADDGSVAIVARRPSDRLSRTHFRGDRPGSGLIRHDHVVNQVSGEPGPGQSCGPGAARAPSRPRAGRARGRLRPCRARRSCAPRGRTAAPTRGRPDGRQSKPSAAPISRHVPYYAGHDQRGDRHGGVWKLPEASGSKTSSDVARPAPTTAPLVPGTSLLRPPCSGD